MVELCKFNSIFAANMSVAMKIKNSKRLIGWLWLIVFSPIIFILLALLTVGITADIPRKFDTFFFLKKS